MNFEKIFKGIILVILITIVIRLFVYIIIPPKIEMVIEKGDTIFEFAQLLSVRTRDLMKYNNIKNPRNILVGTKIYSPIPVMEYIKYRLGLEGKIKQTEKSRDIKPLIYDENRGVTGVVFYSSEIVDSPDPHIYCAEYLVIGHMFLEDKIKFDFVESANKLRVYELAGENALFCKVKKSKKNRYEIPHELAAQFWSVWNNFNLNEKMIVFYKGEL